MNTSFLMTKKSIFLDARNRPFKRQKMAMKPDITFLIIIAFAFVFFAGCNGNNTGANKFIDSVAQSKDTTPRSQDSVTQSNIRGDDAREGMRRFHEGIDMAKSGREMVEKAEKEKDKSLMQRGMEMIDKGMETMNMGKSMIEKDKNIRDDKTTANDMKMMDKGMNMIDMGKDTAASAMGMDMDKMHMDMSKDTSSGSMGNMSMDMMDMDKMDMKKMNMGMDMMDKGMNMATMGANKMQRSMQKDKSTMPKDTSMKEEDM